MKSKTKISAFTLALALAGGALIGCGNNTPAPQPEKYVVQYSTSSDYTISGIVSDGYVAGATVTFQVSVENAKKEVSSVKYDSTTITAVGGNYSFTMPSKDVRLYVNLKNKDALEISYTGELKVGKTAVFTINDQDDDPAENPSIEGDSDEVEISGMNVKFLVDGSVTLTFHGTVPSGQELSKDVTYTVAEAVHGETIDDPLTVDEAVEIAHSLDISFSAKKNPSDQYGTAYNVPSEIEYYIEGVVNPDKEITFKNGSSVVEPATAKNVTCYLMGTDYDFEIYATSGSNNLHRSVEAGSRVIVKTHIINFGYGEWTGDNKDVPHATTEKNKGQPETYKDYDTSVYPDIALVDNSQPTMVSIDFEGEKLQISADSAQPNHTATVTATVLPASVNQAAVFSVEDPTVASVEGTTVTGLTEGNTKLIATAGELKDELPVQVFAGAVVPDAGSDIDYPFTVAQARAKATEIGTTSNGVKYYIRGLVKNIKTAYSSTNENISLNLIDEGHENDIFIAYQTGITKAEADSIVEGQTVVTVYGTIYNYQGNTPETEGKKASSVVRIVTPEIELTSITVSPATKTIKVDETADLTAIPNTGANLGEVTWSVQSGSEYVDVDQTGKVTAKAVTPDGTPAVVRVTSNAKPEVYGECSITVKSKESPATEKTDVVNAEFTGIAKPTGQYPSYSDWSGKVGSESGTTYAGNSTTATDEQNNSLQLRWDTSNASKRAGIWNSASVGNIVSITAVFDAATGDTRELLVFGLDSACTGVADTRITDNSKALGSLTKANGTLEISGEYAFFAVRSKTGAMYITSLSITWNVI